MALTTTTTNRPAPTAPRTTRPRRHSSSELGCSMAARARSDQHDWHSKGRPVPETTETAAAAAAAAAAAFRTCSSFLPLPRLRTLLLLPSSALEHGPFANASCSLPWQSPASAAAGAATAGCMERPQKTAVTTTRALPSASLASVLRTEIGWDSSRTRGRRARRTKTRRRRRRRSCWRARAGAAAASRAWRSG
jgi:hypothetical protein